MKRFGVVLVLAAGMAVGAAWSGGRTQLPEEDLPPLPTYTIPRATTPVRVDGKLDDQAWEAARPVDLTFWWPEQTGPKDRTRVRLLWDDEALYVGYDCLDHDITAVYTERDDPTYKDDCCEIFINPKPARRPQAYLGMEMSAAAIMYDYGIVMDEAGRIVLYRGFDLQGEQLATNLDGTMNIRGDDDYGWQLEVRIPFKNFDDLTKDWPPKPGDEWQAQINRWNGVEPDRALCLWTHSGRKSSDPHNPDRFGTLLFSGE